MATPWEILIKNYRDKLIGNHRLFPTLREYALDFFELLKKQGDKLFPLSVRKTFVNALIQQVMENDIRGTIQIQLKDTILRTAAGITHDQVEQITHEVITNLCN